MQDFPDLIIKKEVADALINHQPVVALESTVITHGLPRPENWHLAKRLQEVIREKQAIPATVALIKGKINVGLDDSDLEMIAINEQTHKISTRDLALGIAQGWDGGTTVAGTLVAAQMAGISVFATGGIGGVHRGSGMDISADLPQLSKSSLIVVCSGAKAILDLSATLEYLETMSIPVIGYRTDEFPAFYTRRSGFKVNLNASTPEQIADIAHVRWNRLNMPGSILVVNPPPQDIEMGSMEIETQIQASIQDAEKQGIRGAAITPYLLQRLNSLTNGSSMKTNLELLISNAKLAADIAVAFSKYWKK
jgi:pseudouridine-5'-phosphate glycosidase